MKDNTKNTMKNNNLESNNFKPFYTLLTFEWLKGSTNETLRDCATFESEDEALYNFDIMCAPASERTSLIVVKIDLNNCTSKVIKERKLSEEKRKQYQALGKIMTLEEALNLGWACLDVLIGRHKAEDPKDIYPCYKKLEGSYELSDLEDLFRGKCNNILQDLYVRIIETRSTEEGSTFATAYTIGTTKNYNDGCVDVRFNEDFEQVVISDICGAIIASNYTTFTYKDWLTAFKKFRKYPSHYTTTTFDEAVEDFKAWLIYAQGANPEDIEDKNDHNPNWCEAVLEKLSHKPKSEWSEEEYEAYNYAKGTLESERAERAYLNGEEQ